MFITLHAQTKISSCLYIGDKEKYVLSEKIRSEDGKVQTFNSLFIWDKDKVIRIVFLYDRKLSRLSTSVINHLQTFESFLPTFKRCTWYENPKYKSKRIVIFGIEIYDETFADGRENDTRGDEFRAKLKTLINARNKKYNPLADKFGSIYVSDGDPEVMIYNEKRKVKEINNFPLLINSAKGDSPFIISPIHIDVYRIDKSEKNTNSISKKITGYRLYSTVSFLKQSIKYPTKEEINESYKGPLGDVIENNDLLYLYRINFSVDTASLMNELSELRLSDKPYFNNIRIDEPKVFRWGKMSKKDSINIKEDSVRKKVDSIKLRESSRSRFLNGIAFDYQYCAECYDAEIPKKTRINNHCPFKFSLYKNLSDDNWSYAFSNKYRHFFEVENRPREIMQDMHGISWLMMSPGIGFWMSNVANYNSRYSTNFYNLFLNGKKISE
ncbi:hypothetical protein [Mucilaginibacter gotjawali]|uniref:Uncharacterized protein n=1 Tax=Mucilaginibacter gotjawali TaxID=1550579 RepID=A0A839SCW7_9SPHI|nr:hypothetical protein [Mucilaginibacter gotjawali]MBB3054407.1 hypothetical protein [Mucilaginibacter gotjawali]